jgi:hypothetical protein
MGQNIYTAPLAKINDGMNDIVYISATKSRKQLFSHMLAVDDGKKWFIKSKNPAKNGLLDTSNGL